MITTKFLPQDDAVTSFLTHSTFYGCINTENLFGENLHPTYPPQATRFDGSEYQQYVDMNQQDRKRAFGNAFQGASNLSSHPHRKALRSVVASSPASTPQIFYAPTFSFGSDKENETLYLPAQEKFAKPFDGYRHRLQLPPRTSSLRGLSERPVAGNGFEQTYITPHMDIDQGSSSPLDQVLGAYSNEPGPIVFEDPVGGVGPLTPSALHFQTLSLLDPPRRYRPDLTSQSAVDINAARTSVFTMQSTDLQ